MKDNNLEEMTVGGGCFWCVEAVIKEVKGVEKIISGYTGGTAPGKPTYKEVCSGLTGHAEVIQITFDSSIISYEDLLVIFMTSHDPTTLNRQGADVGTQYRSAIYYHNEAQKELAKKALEKVTPYYDEPIVTELTKLGVFYEAEDYHQDYYANNPENGYCNAVITPKLTKLRKLYGDRLK
ncbi:peptide-methionine (S)-S-oxide reductase MsrA [Cellulophaga baltica]|uniref:peptide-methionine (S)-S-oxide reductase MsrA n=1 Tax=Cellulophaga TaxID=104264 RepID=UPI001C067A5E|nr:MULTISPECIES: peptide-methionine (S)-S-oxide reductase MsrA [Cellulophaga]MBU2996701.1 peptide-methionine (S)-S-oxide reductase MsrA [Cellulophaga baltica]MDO6768095.1 peptide-methionine (S)-S-oxide reductase MsrA [Cellulophaga sp. 1_MG-2023]